MHPDTRPLAMERFLAGLCTSDVAWLKDQLANSEGSPPPDWVQWAVCIQGQWINAGCMPAERATQMAEHVPNMHVSDGLWRWDTGPENLAWRNTIVQQWLWQSHLQGDLPDWRYEAQDWLPDPALHALDGTAQAHEVGFRIERTGFRHLGLRSRAVHVNGFTADGQLVVGLRSRQKRQDPGLYDNLMAGGMSAGESWRDTLRREMQEEAGLDAAAWPDLPLAACVHSSRAEGNCWHSETLLVCHVVLSKDMRPHNQDGEVERFTVFSAEEALARMRSGEFTRDGILALALAVGEHEG
jgi:8-oxo-dGTP pyrophosphatase MutT (NUDIX family)